MSENPEERPATAKNWFLLCVFLLSTIIGAYVIVRLVEVLSDTSPSGAQ